MPVKILVVDDEPEMERLIRQIFRAKVVSNEYEITFANNGVKALEALEADADIDIVLSDINMPQMDGLTFISKLHDSGAQLKTIMVSAYGDMKNIRTAMNNGAFDFVTKPIDFDDLQTTMDKTIKEIKGIREAAEMRDKLQKIEQELDMANRVQQSILPKDFDVLPEGSNLDIYAEMIPAKTVGGDFYDFYVLDDDHLGIVIGDVSGKGMPAALLMAICQTLMRSTAFNNTSVTDCLNHVNSMLSRDNPQFMFVTLFYGVLNLKTHVLEYGNCGHNPPCLIKNDGAVVFLERSTNIPLGILNDFQYEARSIQLEPGEGLVLYTDGITEAMDAESNLYTENRLLSFLKQSGTATSRDIIKGVVEEVYSFASGAPQADDITTVVLQFKR